MRYCFDNHISIDEAFFGDPIFKKERCEQCKKKSTCSIYRKEQLTPVKIEEREGGLHITANGNGRTQLICELYGNDTLKSNFSSDIQDVETIVFQLR
jgi:hypothetical protein